MGRGEPFASLGGSGLAKIGLEELDRIGELLERLVLLLHVGFFRSVEPVSFAVIERVEDFGIELLVVDGSFYINGRGDVHTDEAATTCWVGQEIGAVARADERSIAWESDGCGGIRTAHTDGGSLQQVFDMGLLRLAILVELIDVDEQVAVEGEGSIAPAGEIKTVGVSYVQFGREELIAECGFMTALWAYEQWRYLVAVAFVKMKPMSHHAEQPAAEELRPTRIVARNALC